MNDRRRLLILALLMIFAVSLPFWPFSEADYPESPPPPGGGACLSPAPLMRAEHGRGLKAWRNMALRQGLRPGPGAYSLDSCLACHTDYKGFCLKCHDRLGVAPGCFNCHLESPPESRLWPEKAETGGGKTAF